MNQEPTGKLLTAKRIKIGVALIIICAIVAGGGSWYYHQQKEAKRAQLAQAQTRMVQYQANQNNMQLLDETKVRALAAQAIGLDESQLTFKQIQLENKWDDAYPSARQDRAHHEPDRHHTGAPVQPNGQGQQPNTAQTGPAAQSPAGAPAGQSRFYPVYEVECVSGTMEYELEIDAVSGAVLESDVDDRL